MIIGCLGEITFEVSDSIIKTLRDASWSGSASIQTHQRHLRTPLQEFVGVNPEAFEFKIRISAFLGADPHAEIERIRSYTNNGTAVQLTIGTESYGKYRWLISKYKISMEHFDKAGNLVGIDVTVSLTEYAKE